MSEKEAAGPGQERYITYVTFSDSCRPGLDPGRYTVDVSHAISGKARPHLNVKEFKADDGIKATKEISIGSERFRLGADSVYSTYPPENHSAYVGNRLPHVVLTKASLPWARSPSEAVNDKTVRIPWLCLLLFDEDDPIPPTLNLRLADLKASTIDPGLDLKKAPKPWPKPIGAYSAEPGETDDDPIQAIDVPLGLLKDILPSPAERRMLAHVRTVERANKAFAPGFSPLALLNADARKEYQLEATQEFSVIIGNRLPRPGKKSVVHLVSLEDIEQSIRTCENLEGPAVRLATLMNWSFSCANNRGGYLDLVHLAYRLDKECLAMPASPQAAPGDPEAAIAKALDRGCVPLDHTMRQGTKTVSWYRGPLSPRKPAGPSALSVPVSDGDALSGYNPSTGMFDVSYSAAWRLGQLLAIREKDFAAGLARWKRRHRASAIDAVERELLEKLNGSSDPGRRLREILDGIMGEKK